MSVMDLVSGIVLGAVQGITEFLPVSSTGHLILVRDMLGINVEHGLAFDAVLHLATALAVLIYFRRDIVSFFKPRNVEGNRTLLTAIVLGTIPAVIAGLALEGFLETNTRNPFLVAFALILGSALFVAAELLGRQKEKLTRGKGFWIGVFQTLALVPGISRSGASISGGLLFGLSREEATRFAFLLSFPILFGVGTSKLFELGAAGFLTSLGIPLLAGSIIALAVGLVSIHFMVLFLKRHSLYIFALYRVALAVAVFIIL